MASQSDLIIALRATDAASAVLKSVGASTQQMGNSAKSAGPSWLSMASAVTVGTTAAHAFMGVARGLMGVFSSAASSTADFGQSMADIRSLVPTADFDQFGTQIQQLAMRLGKDYPLSAAEAGNAMTLMAQKGISVEQMLNGGAEAVVKLSSATGADLVTSAGIAANALDTFGVAAEDMGSVTNLMVGAMTRGGVSATDYGSAMAASGAVIKLAGGDVEDFSIAVAAMAKAGIEGSDAGTSLKSMYMNLQPTTKAAIATARELGIITKDGSNQFFDAAGNVKSYEEISGVLANSLKGLTKEQQLAKLETIFGSDAIRAAAVAAKLGAGEYGNLGEQIRNVDAGDVAAKRMDSLKGSLEQFKGSAETAGLSLMNGLSPALKQMIDWATEGINTVMPHLEEFGAKIGTAFTDGVTTAKDWFRQLVDAWETTKQAFAGNWAPDASIEPLALSAGNAAIKVKDLGDFIQGAADKAGNLGAWQNLERGLANLRDTANSIPTRLSEIADSLDRLNGASGGTSTKVDALGGILKVVAIGFELWSISMKFGVDTMVLVGNTATNFLTVLANIGRGVKALATGDMPGLSEAVKGAGGALLDMVGDTIKWQQGAETAIRKGARAIGLEVSEQTTLAQMVGSANMQKLADAVDSNMTAANESVGTNSAGMQRFMEENGAGVVAAAETSMADATAAVDTGSAAMVAALDANAPAMVAAAETAGQGVATATDAGMVQAVAAVDANAPLAVASAEAMGTGMSGAIEAAAPAMAAAADSGASGAVAAVDAYQGSANASGAALGSNLGAGMFDGITSWVGRVAAAARGLVNAAVGAGNVEGEVQSPSKKTTKTGEELGKGYLVGLESVAPEVRAVLKNYLSTAAEYVPIASEIKRVEREIKDIRDKAQTDAMFRAEKMIDLESEMLRLKKDQVYAERDLLPARQALAAATREVSDLERGTLPQRQAMIEMDGQRKALRLQTLDLEKQLVGMDRDSKRAEGIQKQIDALRDQDQLLSIETERIRLTNEVAATGARVRREGLDDNVLAQQRVIDAINDQLAVLAAEDAVFRANEAVIKNATDNEVGYRERLIAVFKSEGKPLADRVAAGLLLIDQLEAEGKISKELADQLRKVGKEATDGVAPIGAMGTAAATAAPQIDAAAKKAEEMAKQAKAVAKETKDAAEEVDALSSSLGKLPSWFTPKGGGKDMLGFGGGKAMGGPVMPSMSYLVGETGPEMFVPHQSGSILPAGMTAALLAGDMLRASAQSGGGSIGGGSSDTYNFYGVQPESVHSEAERRKRQQAYLKAARRA